MNLDNRWYFSIAALAVKVPSYRAGGEQPANDGPAGQDVRAQHLIGWVHHSTDVADEVAAQ